MFSPLGGHETRDLRQSISRARKPMYWTSGIKCPNKRIHFYSTIQGGSHLGVILWKTFFSRFLTYIGVKSCEKSIARIPEAWKRFLDPDSGKESVYWSENQTFSDFYEKTVYIQGVSKVRKHLNFSIKMCLFIITKTTTIQNVLSWPVFVTSSFSVALNSLVDGGIWDTQN